jgi:hypothetical protein
MIGYTTLDKSMNGIKTLSDGITNISNGNITANQMTTNQISSSTISSTNSSSLKNLTITGDCVTQKLDVSGISNFTVLPTYTGTLNTASNNNLITKSYADTNYASSAINILNNVNTWTQTNTFNNNIICPGINSISSTKINYLSNVTSDIQTQINNNSSNGTSLQNQITTNLNSQTTSDTNLQNQITTNLNSQTTSNTNLQNQIATNLNTLTSTDNNLQTQITSNLNTLSSTDNNLQTQINNNKNNIINNSGQINNLQYQVTYNLNTQTTNDTTLQNNINTNSNSITSINSTLTNHQSQITTNTNSINSINTTSTYLQTQINNSDQDIITLYGKCANTDAIFADENYYSKTFHNNKYIFTGSIENTQVFKTYQNTVSSSSINSKTAGDTSTILTLNIKANFNKIITVTSPISVYRQYNNNSGSNINLVTRLYDTLNSVSYIVYKNNSFFTSGTCTYSDTLPKTIYFFEYSSTSTRNYECYMTNASMEFLTTDEDVDNVYKVNYIINHTSDTSWQSYNLNIINQCVYVNTNINSSTVTINGSGGPGSSYVFVNYSLSDQNNYFSGTGQIMSNQLISNTINNQNAITTNQINSLNGFITNMNSTNVNSTNVNSTNVNSTNIYSSYITSRNITAGYICDGPISGRFNMYPIVCSQKYMNPNNADDFYIIGPGYKFIVYQDDNYSNTNFTADNTNNNVSNIFTCPNVNTGSSIRVYFNNVEITISPIS